MAKETLKTLILTDSAGKARTIKKFLGSSYKVISTEGLLMNLPKSRLGIDEETFAPEYIKVVGTAPLRKEIERESLNARRVFFLMNPDGAGEFLARQCCNMFGVNAKSKCRIFLDEITKDKIKNLQDYARPIDENLVNAFQTRQIIDKFASHKIGEYLSCKIYRGVKVGRFRAMLLKLIAGENFPSEIILSKNLTPAVLQELAYHKLNFSAARTYLTAEQLFEGVNISEDLRTGLIKYPHGKNISLTDEKINPADVKNFLSDAQFQLYNLIYSQTVESKITLSGACNDLAIMAALDNLKIDWADFYSRDMASLLKRKYIAAENSEYKITALGKKVLAALEGFFDEDFSADTYNKISAQIEEVEAGKVEKLFIIANYCNPFNKNFKKAMESLGENAVPQKQPDEISDEICEKCGKPMLIKYGRFGKFLACSGYPECKNTRPITEKTNLKCPKCGGNLIKNNFGKNNSYGCESCDFKTWDEPQEKVCESCGSTRFLHKFKNRPGMFYCGNEKCITRENHPINKILAAAEKRALTRKKKNAK